MQITDDDLLYHLMVEFDSKRSWFLLLIMATDATVASIAASLTFSRCKAFGILVKVGLAMMLATILLACLNSIRGWCLCRERNAAMREWMKRAGKPDFPPLERMREPTDPQSSSKD